MNVQRRFVIRLRWLFDGVTKIKRVRTMGSQLRHQGQTRALIVQRVVTGLRLTFGSVTRIQRVRVTARTCKRIEVQSRVGARPAASRNAFISGSGDRKSLPCCQ